MSTHLKKTNGPLFKQPYTSTAPVVTQRHQDPWESGLTEDLRAIRAQTLAQMDPNDPLQSSISRTDDLAEVIAHQISRGTSHEITVPSDLTNFERSVLLSTLFIVPYSFGVKWISDTTIRVTDKDRRPL